MKKLLYLTIFLILLTVGLANAMSSPAFIDYVTNIVWEDCQGLKDIMGKPITKELLRNGLIEWDKNAPRDMIIFERDVEKYPLILSCNNKNLRWHQENYYWDGTRIDPAISNLIVQVVKDVVNSTIAQSATLEGDSQAVAGIGNTACQGGNCEASNINWFSKNNITWGGTVFNIGIYIVLTTSLYFLYKRKIKKHLEVHLTKVENKEL